jgi:hypothetical protein
VLITFFITNSIFNFFKKNEVKRRIKMKGNSPACDILKIVPGVRIQERQNKPAKQKESKQKNKKYKMKIFICMTKKIKK